MPETRNPKPIYSLFILLLSAPGSYAQPWENVGSGLTDNVYALVQKDSQLYACGRVGIKYWNGSAWGSLSKPLPTPLTMAVYNDSLYVSGDAPGGGSYSQVYQYKDGNWVQAGGHFEDPHWSSTKVLFTFKGQLISGGHYSSVDGETIHNIASWDGTSWSGLGNGLNGVVSGLAEHDGELYASGDFTASGTDTTVNRIAKWNGTKWSPIDTRLRSGGPMVSFNGDLIIANVWDTISGTPMLGIAKWTGNSFIAMGNALIQDILNFKIFNNELYLCGRVDGITPNAREEVVMKWTGTHWQLIGSPFDQTILSMEEYNGELFCGGFFTMNGADPVKYVAKTAIISSVSDSGALSAFTVYPNPTNGSFVFETGAKGALTIYNHVGQVVRTIPIDDHSTPINTDDLQSGVYFLEFRSDKGRWAGKLVKQ